MKILMMGPQGCGKGTIGEMLEEHLGILLVSVGNILRGLEEDHPWYQEINEQMKNGHLVDQQKVAKLLEEEFKKEKYSKGFILDGWYRSMLDVKYYEVDLDKVFLLEISPQTTLKRLGSRRTCSNCGKIYNIITPSEKPRVDGVCDVCGGELIQRQDDTEDAILKRLAIYKEETAEVIKYLSDKGLLIRIDGEGTPEEVFNLVKQYLG